MKYCICMLFLCLLGGLVLAETCAASICDTKETVIFFGNGIITPEDDAFNSQNIIKKRLKTILSTDEFDQLEFDLAYNDTHGLPLDLLESTIQILTGNVSRFWRLFWNLEPLPDNYCRRQESRPGSPFPGQLFRQHGIQPPEQP